MSNKKTSKTNLKNRIKFAKKVIGKNNPGFAFGTAIFMAAGTAIYDALAPSIANNN